MTAQDTAYPRHFLDLSDLSSAELRLILDMAKRLKAQRVKGAPALSRPLAGKYLAMIFDKPSTRTRVSFDIGMRDLGGETLVLTGKEMQIGRGETIADTARVLSRFVDAIMIRILSHEDLIELARHSSVPVINGLTKVSHPCQLMADIMTFEEHLGSIAGRTVAWVGDANNVLTSWVHAAARFGFAINAATPSELSPDETLRNWAQANKVVFNVTQDPREAVAGVDAVITDCWVSMGDKDEEIRRRILTPYQVNAQLMSCAAKEAIFMHCLPAHRGEEVSASVIDGPRSVIWREAYHRRTTIQALLYHLSRGELVGSK
jgi:ornithine carbamoyltransferase